MSRFAGYALAGAALSGGCVRDPVEAVCPALGEGDLRVSELRGPQSGGDTWGEWIELENLTGGDVDLQGLVVDILAVDGGTHLRMGLRTSVTIAAGDRIVIGRFDAATQPAYVDVAAGTAWSEDLPTAGAVTLSSCGAQIDRAVYENLPTMGTFTRTADGWCVDTSPGDDPTMMGLPGTPGAENTPCP